MPVWHGLALSSKPTNPAHFSIEHVIRPNILSLQPYRCARDDYSTGILLDANENSLGHSLPRGHSSLPAELHNLLDLDLHRYPSPSHDELKAAVADLRGLGRDKIDHVFLGVGSDEIIDLLMRVCVKPGGQEKIMITPPTYGMYKVTAHVNDVGVVSCDLELEGKDGVDRFELRVDRVRIREAPYYVPLLKLPWNTTDERID
jgi:histidinol-phosphate aminotransferase